MKEKMNNKQSGYVYILTNPSFKENWVKVVMSSRPVDVHSKELDNTADPLPFEVFAIMKTTKYNEAEKLVHRYIERFTKLRIRNNREFFNVKPEKALEIFRDVALVTDDAEIEEVYKKDFSDTTEREPQRAHSFEGGNRVWLIPSNQKLFDLHSFFKKYGQVYWSQYVNFHKGDTGYIYSSSPESGIRYSFEIVESEIKYSDELKIKADGFADYKDFEEWKKHNRYALIRMTGSSTGSRLSLAHLLSHGLKMAPRGALKLSDKGYEELKRYIEDNF